MTERQLIALIERIVGPAHVRTQISHGPSGMLHVLVQYDDDIIVSGPDALCRHLQSAIDQLRPVGVSIILECASRSQRQLMNSRWGYRTPELTLAEMERANAALMTPIRISSEMVREFAGTINAPPKEKVVMHEHKRTVKLGQSVDVRTAVHVREHQGSDCDQLVVTVELPGHQIRTEIPITKGARLQTTDKGQRLFVPVPEQMPKIDPLKFLLGLYGFLGWVRKINTPVHTSDSEIRFSLLELA